MSCVDLKEQFLSYVDGTPQHSSYWNQSLFMKSCNEALVEISTLNVKVKEMQNAMKHRITRNSLEESKMLTNVKENIRICQAHLKKINLMAPDMKSSDRKFVQEYKSSIVATLEMKIMEIGMKFKNIYEQRNLKIVSAKDSKQNNGVPNLSRSLFLEQSQEEIMEEVAVNEYKDIEKSIVKISQMYKQTLSMVKMHEFMIDSIVSDIDDTEMNVQKGRKNLSQAHRRTSKNRPMIIKVFITLYVVVFVYIVILS